MTDARPIDTGWCHRSEVPALRDRWHAATVPKVLEDRAGGVRSTSTRRDRVLRARRRPRLFSSAWRAAAAARRPDRRRPERLPGRGATAVASHGSSVPACSTRCPPVRTGAACISTPAMHWAARPGRYVAAREAADIGRAFGVPDLEMLGLALEGARLVARASAKDAPGLDEATADRRRPRDFDRRVGAPLPRPPARRSTSSSAFAWSDRIAEFADRHGSR